MEGNQLQLMLAAIRCYIQSLAADFAWATEEAKASAHSSSLNNRREECIGKLDSDATGLMRACLRMYNLVEEDGGSNSLNGCSAEELTSLGNVVHEFVRDTVDEAILSADVLALCSTSRISALREQTLLLLNALRVMAEEKTSKAGSEEHERTSQPSQSKNKRGRFSFCPA